MQGEALKEKILIIESDRVRFEKLGEIISRHGYKLSGPAVSKKEAVEKIETERPDLVLADLKICRDAKRSFRPREILQEKDLPVVVLVEDPDDPWLASSDSAGADSVLIQPVSENELMVTVRLALRYHSLEAKLGMATVALEEADRFTREVISQAGEGLVVTNSRSMVLVWNRFMEELTGIPDTEALGKNFPELVVRVSGIGIEGLLEKAFKGEKVISHDMVFPNPPKDGDRWISASFSPFRNKSGEIIGVISTLQDITARKKILKELEDREWELFAIYEHAPSIMLLLDKEKRIRKINRAGVEFARVPHGSMIGQRSGDGLMCLNSLEGVSGCGTAPVCQDCPIHWAVRDTLETGQVFRNVEISLPFKNDAKTDLLDLLVSTSPLDEKGNPMALLTIIDITEKKRIMGKLSRQESKLAGIFRSAPVGIAWVVDRVVLEGNQNLFEMTGWSSDELLGKTTQVLYPSGEEFVRVGRDLYDQIHAQGSGILESRWRKKDGTVIEVLLKGSIVDLKDFSKGFIICAMDITLRKKIENSLAEALKAAERGREELSALFQAAQTIVHDKDFSRVSKAVFENCRNLIQAGSGFLALLSKNGLENHVLFFGGSGSPWNLATSTLLPMVELQTEVFQSRRTLVKNDFGASLPRGTLPETHPRIENLMLVPLLYDDVVHGIMGLADKAGGFSTQDSQIADIFGELISVALMNSRILQAMEDSRTRFEDLFQKNPLLLIEADWSEAKAELENLRNWGVDDPEKYFASHPQELEKFFVKFRVIQANEQARDFFGIDPKNSYNQFELLKPISDSEFREELKGDLIAIFDGRVEGMSGVKRRSADGRTIEAIRRWCVVAGHEKDYSRVITSLDDVTELKQAQGEAAEMGRRFRTVFEEIHLLTVMLDTEGKITHVNKSFLDLTGWTAENVIGEDWFSRFAPSQKELRGVFLANLKVPKPYLKIEYEIPTRSGELRMISWNRTLLHDVDGNVIGTASIGEDITERQRMVRDLERSKEAWERTFDAVPDMVLVLDEKKRILRMNKAAAARVGKTPAELEGHFCHEIFHDSRQPPIFCPHGKLLSERREQLIETQDSFMGGDFLVSVSPILDSTGAFVSCVHVARDITELKKAKSEEEKSREKFKLLFERMMEPFALHEIVHDDQGNPRDYRFLEVNPAFERLVKSRSDEILGKTVREILPEISPFWIDTYGRVALTGENIHFEQYSPELQKYFEVSAFSPQKNRFATIFSDITTRKIAESALEESEERFRALSVAAQEGIAILRESVVHDCNEQLVNMFGLSKAKSILGFSILKLFPPAPRKGLRIWLKEDSPEPIEVETRQQGGKRMWVKISAQKIGFRGELVRVITVQDLTTQKESAERLRESNERLHALTSQLQSVREEEKNRLSREIHDELGQILTVTQSEMARVCQWVRKGTGKTHPERILEKMGQIRKLVEETLDSIRRIARELHPSIIEDLGLVPALDWLIANFGERTDLKCSFRPTSKKLEVDSEISLAIFRILQEALTNILKHAQAKKVDIRLSKRGGNAVLTVDDDGIGIENTRLDSSGGLGIIGMRERARQWGGILEVAGIPGKGTSVQLSIPIKSKNSE